MFIPITKIDEEKRMVYGVAADETPDRQQEIFDYESSKPLFDKWSKNAAKSSDGKSLGNLRSMHTSIAAGKLTAIDFNDAAKAIEVAAYVVDDAEWEKAKEGVYTGFSVGGKYVRRWSDNAQKGFKRYTLQPSEISLADLPCNPSTVFDAVKADGLIEQRSFKVSDKKETVVRPGEVGFSEALDALKTALIQQEAEKISKRPDVSESDKKEADSEYGDVEYADAKNKKYPIDTAAHVRAAASYFGMPKNRSKYSEAEQKTIDAKIAKAKEKFGIGAGNGKKIAWVTAKKSMYDVQSLANVLSGLCYMHDSLEAERDREGDDSDVPERFGEAVETLAEIFLDMAHEETAELLEELGLTETPQGEKTMKTEALKAAMDEMAKKAAAAKAAAEEEDGDGVDEKHVVKAYKMASKVHGHIEDAHKAMGELKDHLALHAGMKEGEKEGAAKAVASETAADAEAQKLLDAATEALGKLQAENEALKAVSLKPRSAGAGAVVTKLEDAAKVAGAEKEDLRKLTPGKDSALKALQAAKQKPIDAGLFKQMSQDAARAMASI